MTLAEDIHVLKGRAGLAAAFLLMCLGIALTVLIPDVILIS